VGTGVTAAEKRFKSKRRDAAQICERTLEDGSSPSASPCTTNTFTTSLRFAAERNEVSSRILSVRHPVEVVVLNNGVTLTK
jgi:hypothetical protein